MTVASTTRKQIFAGAQAALTFSFRTLVNHPEYIKVKNTLISSGYETDLTYGVDYTVALEADGTGGTVNISPTFSALYNHTVYRDTDDTQESDYDDFNQFPSDTVENDFDRRTLISQERADDVDRTAKAPISYTGGDIILPNPQDGYSLVWSGSGGKLINSNLVGPTGPAGPSGSSGSFTVSSSTTDLTVSPTSGNVIISSVNAATGGSNKILRLDSSGKLPALDGSQLTNLPAGTTPYIKCSWTATSGTDSADATSGAYRTVTLNTKDSDTSTIATLSSNQITLPAGTYRVFGTCLFYQTAQSKVKLQNISDSTVTLYGDSIFTNNTQAIQVPALVRGIFTIASAKTFELQYQVTTTKTGSGLGNAASFGTEVYATIEFWKTS